MDWTHCREELLVIVIWTVVDKQTTADQQALVDGHIRVLNRLSFVGDGCMVDCVHSVRDTVSVICKNTQFTYQLYTELFIITIQNIFSD